jgi:hypothetical protein
MISVSPDNTIRGLHRTAVARPSRARRRPTGRGLPGADVHPLAGGRQAWHRLQRHRTFAAATGEPNLVEKIKQGYQCGGKTFKVHLDRYNLMPYFKVRRGSRRAMNFFTGATMADLLAIRVKQWMVAFMAQHDKVSDKCPAGRRARSHACVSRTSTTCALITSRAARTASCMPKCSCTGCW